MLSIPVKKTELVRISKSLETFILKNYDSTTAERVRPFISQLDELRKVVSDSGDTGNLDSTITAAEMYLSGLKAIESRIPISGTDIKFQWFDSYTKSKVPVLSFPMERVAMMYSMSGLLSKIGSEIDLRGQNAHKTALNSFQLAIGWLSQCRDLIREANIRSEIRHFPRKPATMVGHPYSPRLFYDVR